MIDDRTRELIQSGLDGELDDASAQELRLVLEGSEEARHYHSELNRLSDFLDKIPDHELPTGLHARITSQVKLPSPSPLKSFFSFREMPGFLRYGFAAAAGLVLAVAIYESRHDLRQTDDFSNMVGTMTRGGPLGAVKTLDTYEFDTDGISGNVSLQRRNGSLVLEMLLISGGLLDFSVDFSGIGLAFEAFAQMDSELESIAYADGVLQGRGQGRQRFVVLLHRDDEFQPAAHAGGAGPRIGLEFSQEGESIQSGWLEPDS